MSDPRAGLVAGTFHVQALERILFGMPAGEAVVAEAERVGAKRVFVNLHPSLAQKENGPLQRMQKALGARPRRHLLTIRSHSPREDVVAGAKAAREAKADLLVAVGGGSVIDATKAMQLCLWLGLDSPEAMEPYCLGFERNKYKDMTLPTDPIRMIAVSTTLSASGSPRRRHPPSRPPTPSSLFATACSPRVRWVLDPESTLDTPRLAALLHRHPLGRPRGRELLQRQGEPGYRGPLAGRASSFSLAHCPPSRGARKIWHPGSRPRSACGRRSPLSVRCADGCQPWHRLRARRHVRCRHGHTSCVMLHAVLKWERGGQPPSAKGPVGQRWVRRAVPRATTRPRVGGGLDQPTTLQAVGIKRENLDEIARRALAYHPVQVNSRPSRPPTTVKEILEIAW